MSAQGGRKRGVASSSVWAAGPPVECSAPSSAQSPSASPTRLHRKVAPLDAYPQPLEFLRGEEFVYGPGGVLQSSPLGGPAPAAGACARSTDDDRSHAMTASPDQIVVVCPAPGRRDPGDRRGSRRRCVVQRPERARGLGLVAQVEVDPRCNRWAGGEAAW